MKRTLSFCAVAVTLAITGCNQPANTHDADVKAIQDTEVQWNQDIAAKDVGKLVAHYTDDGVLLVCGSPAAVGKAAIEAAFRGLLADPAMSLKFHSTRVEVAKSGDVGSSYGVYTLDVTDPTTKQVVHDHGNYITTFLKQADGSWKAVFDSPVSEVPPPMPPPAPEKKKK